MYDPGIAHAYLHSGGHARRRRHEGIGWVLLLLLALCAAGLARADGPGPAAGGAATTVPAPATATAAGPAAAGPAAAEAPAGASSTSLDEDVQGLRKEVVDLNRDLFLLEEELLFPANTQVAVFLSMDVGTFFALDSVQLRIGDKEVANYLYTQREVDALVRGGVQRLWLGNLKVGKHELVALFTGKGPHDRDYRRGATLTIDKGVGAKYVELRISDRAQKLQPEFVVKEWE